MAGLSYPYFVSAMVENGFQGKLYAAVEPRCVCIVSALVLVLVRRNRYYHSCACVYFLRRFLI
jgi:hypothetical protein